MQQIYTILCTNIVQNEQVSSNYPLFISIAALVCTLVYNIITTRISNNSLKELKNSNKRNVRPFLTIENSSVTNEKNKVVPELNAFIIRTKNAPAKIINFNFEFNFTDKTNGSKEVAAVIPLPSQLIYFPDDKVINKIEYNNDHFISITDKSKTDKTDLVYDVVIEYSPIDSDDIYTTIINQKLESHGDDIFWKMISISAT
ncbi:hypothetical protein I6H88_13970 [Elizabethkingia bruuniana]|uniref:Uncharacterized protein n=1 Tax=Elizabethkingia bruuniana TaxID=1756149 RepID=A0A7T7ZWX8_9FLAO|nr:hypothetical protein [Elizabethkingia bruuniana]KGO10253.1 hypothetical protein KS04_11050 [Elizabethkingia miricola]AQX84057.1 hypothetical protein AYC65_03040 [Elizabethkingia bruuniana]OPB64478.1 hypothetical protein BAY12_06680 [Elizabethkingia bruuniana]QDZ63210.1 hypothetical protein EVD20_12005 [Elizabethkingia bruuniana]QQN57549.1 hypothetical protein I6H88_13970 [Elizabethkingia bruuniana]